MTPVEAIAMLDVEIAEHGDVVTLMQTGQSRNVPAFVRGYRPDEFANGIEQGDSLVVLSPTSVSTLPVSPEAGAKITFGGRVRRVVNVEPVTMKGATVRLNLTVRG